MERTLVLSRKPQESVTLFVGGERVEIVTKERAVLVFKAGEDVRIIRTEILDREEAGDVHGSCL